MNRLLLAMLILIGGLPGMVHSSSDHDTKTREMRENLQQVEQRIGATQQQIEQVRAAAEEQFNLLQSTGRKLRQARSMVKQQERETRRLQREVSAQKERLDQERAESRSMQRQLQTRLVALYKSGEIGMTRMLLSARSPNEMLQDYEFMQLLMRHDRNLLDSFREQLARTEAELRRYEELSAAREEALEEQRRRQQQLAALQKDQKRQLDRLKNDRQALEAVLQELESQATRLSDLLARLESSRPSPYTGDSAFSRQQGRLPWPVGGTIRLPFGRGYHPDLGTRYDSHGIEIAADKDTPIRAVWDGRVAFAQPFRGFGNLMILDHGDGYYTLYAQASHLSFKAGDRVQKGEVLGYSGFEGNDVVYFEIRQGSTPVDPQLWLTDH